ncbi:TS1R1 protein, partial [Turnix velox]|nr:TS1R1 protein [Turnix velox]
VSSADPYSCQPCREEEWSPPRSQHCFNRTLEFLSWSDPISWALLIPTILLLLLMAGLALLFTLNASTPVVRSAGGRMCFLMLGSLACSCGSLLCHFGEPSRAVCLLRLPLFTISFSLFLSCVATRSFQLVCIFKLNARWPALYTAWQRRKGPLVFIAVSTVTQAVLCLAAEVSNPSVPRRDTEAWAERVVLDCGPSSSVGRRLAGSYAVLLSAGCFALSYAGKDLPAGYNEAKCLTCGLLVQLTCSAALLCAQTALQGRAAMAARLLGSFCMLAALLAAYFLPKAFVILLRPHLNTAEHFQMAIQRYTRRLGDA